MKIHCFHSWDVTPQEALLVQARLRAKVVTRAKSLLIGRHRLPGPSRGSYTPLYDANNHIIGAVLRTRDRVRPVFVSVGHRIGLTQAVRLTLACGKGYRIPEPTRQADLLAEQTKRETI